MVYLIVWGFELTFFPAQNLLELVKQFGLLEWPVVFAAGDLVRQEIH